MFKIKKNSYFVIGIFILIISVCLNIYLYSNMIKLKKDSSTINEYLRYLLVLKLDRQSDIFYKLGNFIDQIEKDSLSPDEFNLYLSGTKEFSQNDIIHGVNEIVFEDDKEMVDILTRITRVAATSDDILENAYNNELNNLQERYYSLSSLLNRNNKDSSLTYYILNDIENLDVEKLLKEIKLNLYEMETILNY